MPPARRRRRRAAQCPRRIRDQLLQVGHDRRGRAGRCVELEQGELRVVRARDLAVAEYARELPDAREAARQQSLHRVLGAGVEMEEPRAFDPAGGDGVVRREQGGERPQVGLLPGDRHRDGRLDLEIAAAVEPVAQRAQERGTAAREGGIGGHVGPCTPRGGTGARKVLPPGAEDASGEAREEDCRPALRLRARLRARPRRHRHPLPCPPRPSRGPAGEAARRGGQLAGARRGRPHP